jgi:hypothetical protein
MRLERTTRLHTPDRRIPLWARPYIRLAVVAVLVFIGDRATEELIRNGWTMGILPVTAIRILSALPVLHFPIAGFIFALEVDKWDWFWLSAGSRGEAYQLFYQRWDKVMDLVTLAAAAVVTMRWEDQVSRSIALAAFLWRVLGVLLFVAFGLKWLLLVFPNVFEALFVLYVLFHLLTGRDRMLHSWREASIVLIALLVPKVASEVFLHVMNTRPSDVVSLPIPNGWVEGVFWSALMYGTGALALMWLARRSHVTRNAADREEDLSAV